MQDFSGELNNVVILFASSFNLLTIDSQSMFGKSKRDLVCSVIYLCPSSRDVTRNGMQQNSKLQETRPDGEVQDWQLHIILLLAIRQVNNSHIIMS